MSLNLSLTNGLLACFCVYHASTPNPLVAFLFTGKALMDFVLHFSRVVPMKIDFCLLHVLLLLWSVHYVRVHPIIHSHPAHQTWWTCLNLAEVSSIFLSLLDVDRYHPILSKRWKRMVRILFATTFVYFRLVGHLYLHLSSLQEYTYLVSMVAGRMHAHVFQLSMHAFFALNLYWGCKLIRFLLQR